MLCYCPSHNEITRVADLTQHAWLRFENWRHQHFSIVLTWKSIWFIWRLLSLIKPGPSRIKSPISGTQIQNNTAVTQPPCWPFVLTHCVAHFCLVLCYSTQHSNTITQHGRVNTVLCPSLIKFKIIIISIHRHKLQQRTKKWRQQKHWQTELADCIGNQRKHA